MRQCKACYSIASPECQIGVRPRQALGFEFADAWLTRRVAALARAARLIPGGLPPLLASLGGLDRLPVVG